MKYIKKLIIPFATITIAAVLLIVNACDKSNLDILPNKETEAALFKKEADFTAAVYGVYAKLTDLYSFNNNSALAPTWLLPGDDLTSRGNYPYESFNGLQPADGRLSAYGKDNQSNIWTAPYQVISRANTLLQKLEEENGVITTANLKSTLRGEALFLRSLMYFHLFNFFGTAPLITQRISDQADVNPPSSSGTALLDQAILDLTEAADLLPASWDSEPSQIGRVTKDGANGLLGKCLVFRACYNSAQKQSDYQAAITAFNKITSRQLMTDFGSNFDAFNENNAESLFEFQASNAPAFDCIWLMNDFDIAIGRMSSYWGFFYNAWSWWDGTPIVPTRKLKNAFETGDPRINETFSYLPDSVLVDGVMTKNADIYRYDSAQFQKYVKRGLEGDVTSSVDNPRILRYADVLLLKAEAILKSGGSKAEAIGLINQIRARARNSVTPASTVPADLSVGESNEQTIMQWIMDERLRELCGEEAHRWFDLKRWDKAGYIDLSTWDAGINGFSSLREDFDFPKWYTDTKENMWYPIPTIETDRNPNAKQNPGY